MKAVLSCLKAFQNMSEVGIFSMYAMFFNVVKWMNLKN